MTHASDPDYLQQQYRNAANLDARVALHQLYSTHPQDWHAWVFDQFDLPSNARILELGCGPGALWRANLARIPAGWQIVLSDRSPGMVAAAKKSLAAAGKASAETKSAPVKAGEAPSDMSAVLAAVMDAYAEAGSGFAGIRAAFAAARKARAAERKSRPAAHPDPAPAESAARPAFTFAVLDAQALTYPAGAFDAVIANHMLYHVADKARAFAELRRVLVPGGRLYAATNGTDHMRELRALSRRASRQCFYPPGSTSSMRKSRSRVDSPSSAKAQKRCVGPKS